jgi:hypothetical protein
MSAQSKPDIGERRADRGEGRPLRSVMIAVGTFYVCAALLNGRFLHEDAREREFGRTRDLWVAATRPLYEISTFLGLDTVRARVQTLRNDD